MTGGSARRLVLPLALTMATLLAIPACDDDDGGFEPQVVEIEGSWQQVSGPVVFLSREELAESGLSICFEFGPTSLASCYARFVTSGVGYCFPFIYGISWPSALTLDPGSGQPETFHVARPRPDTLVLAAADGSESVFGLLPAIPDSMRCLELPIRQRLDVHEAVEEGSGLAFDGELLWFTAIAGQLLLGVDPESGAIAERRLMTSVEYPLVHGTQGADQWRRAYSGSRAARITPEEAIVDEVDTGDLGSPMRITSLAFDPGRECLWLWGVRGAADPQIYQIDAAAEPDRLLREHDFNDRIDAMTVRGTEIVALIYGNLAVIDAGSLRVLRTYAGPEEIRPSGVAAVGPRIFLLGTEFGPASLAVIVEVEL